MQCNPASPVTKTRLNQSRFFDTVIPRNVRLAEAPSYGLPGVVFDGAAKGTQAFMAFAKEMIEKLPPAAPEAGAPATA